MQGRSRPRVVRTSGRTSRDRQRGWYRGRQGLSSLTSGTRGFLVSRGRSTPRGAVPEREEREEMIRPSKEDFVRLAADHDVVPVAREVYADLATPISAFMSLAQGAEHAFLLESVVGGERLGRYSFLGVGDREVITARDGEVVVENGGVTGELRARPAHRGRARGSTPAASRGCRACRCSWAAPWASWATRPRRASRRCLGTRTTSWACPTWCSCSRDIVVAFDHARRVHAGHRARCGRAALRRPRTSGRSGVSTQYLRTHRRGRPAAPGLGAVGVTAPRCRCGRTPRARTSWPQ